MIIRQYKNATFCWSPRFIFFLFFQNEGQNEDHLPWEIDCADKTCRLEYIEVVRSCAVINLTQCNFCQRPCPEYVRTGEGQCPRYVCTPITDVKLSSIIFLAGKPERGRVVTSMIMSCYVLGFLGLSWLGFCGVAGVVYYLRRKTAAANDLEDAREVHENDDLNSNPPPAEEDDDNNREREMLPVVTPPPSYDNVRRFSLESDRTSPSVFGSF